MVGVAFRNAEVVVFHSKALELARALRGAAVARSADDGERRAVARAAQDANARAKQLRDINEGTALSEVAKDEKKEVEKAQPASEASAEADTQSSASSITSASLTETDQPILLG